MELFFHRRIHSSVTAVLLVLLLSLSACSVRQPWPPLPSEPLPIEKQAAFWQRWQDQSRPVMQRLLLRTRVSRLGRRHSFRQFVAHCGGELLRWELYPLNSTFLQALYLRRPEGALFLDYSSQEALRLRPDSSFWQDYTGLAFEWADLVALLSGNLPAVGAADFELYFDGKRGLYLLSARDRSRYFELSPALELQVAEFRLGAQAPINYRMTLGDYQAVQGAAIPHEIQISIPHQSLTIDLRIQEAINENLCRQDLFSVPIPPGFKVLLVPN